VCGTTCALFGLDAKDAAMKYLVIDLLLGLALTVLEVAIAPYLPARPAAAVKAVVPAKDQPKVRERGPVPTSPVRPLTRWR
jgi:hypothetical protein